MLCATPHHAPAPPRHRAGLLLGGGADEPLLTPEQERQLARDVARGDRDAADRLARANLGLVVAIARAYRGRGLDIEDLIGEGNLGLLRAVEEYDPGREVRFSTYAAHWIKQAIRTALTNTSRTVRIPAHMVTMLARWSRVERALRGEGCAEPSFDQVADRLGLNDTHREMMRRARWTGRVREDLDGVALTAAASPGEALDRADATSDLRRRLATRLDAREREVVTLRFGLETGEPLTLKQVGERLGMTREWARRIEVKAVAKLGARGDGR